MVTALNVHSMKGILMKLYILLLCIIFVLSNVLYAMEEKKEGKKLDLKELVSTVKFQRPVRSLITLCLPSLAIATADKIKNDASYDLKNFNSLLDWLKAKNVDANKFLRLLHENLNEISFERHSDFLSTYGVNHLHFAGNRFVWNSIADKGRFRLESGTIDEKDHSAQGTSLFGMLHFASSPDFFCYPLKNQLWIGNLKTANNYGCKDFRRISLLKNDDSSLTALALDPCSDRCAVGNEKGEIFIISLLKLFYSEDSDYFYKTTMAHQSSIASLHFTSNSHLFSNDEDGNIVVWGKHHDKKSPENW
jgi:hypothetical protein